MNLNLPILLLLLTSSATAGSVVHDDGRGGTSSWSGAKRARGSTAQKSRELQKQKGGKENGVDLIEVHPCEPDPARAKEYVDIVGYPELGDLDCYVDPVNACGGGCCRFGIYFICDTSNFTPHLACVCNENTAPLPSSPPLPTPAPTFDSSLPVQDSVDQDSNIVDTAVAAGSFTTLVDLVTTAGLVEALKSPGPLILFAPLDSAFPPAGSMLDAFKNATDIDTLTSLLLYHIVEGKIRNWNGGTMPTLQGSNVTLSLTGPMVGTANIVETIQASNGVIYAIDAVLMPPSPSDILDTAIAEESFTTLVDLVITAGLEGTLRDPGPITVFAPSDEAFPQGADLGAFKANTDLEALVSVLGYHVVPGLIRSSDLADGMTLTTTQGGVLSVSMDDATGLVEVNDATIVTADIPASNGIIHVIDTVLMPDA